MEKSKIRLEIYEGDPFGSTCCGPGPQITSLEAAEKLRQMLIERNRTVEKLSMEFRDAVKIEREVISQKRHDYPDYVRNMMFEDKPLPYIFINGETAVIGRFPSYEEFVTLLKKRLESTEHTDK
jgi:tRNA G37 N-methylase TrmD